MNCFVVSIRLETQSIENYKACGITISETVMLSGLNPIAGLTPQFRSLCFGHGSYWLLSRQSVRQESTYYVVVAFSLSITLR